MNNTTKRSIHTSLTALLLCFVMLVGTTFAWFTDTATSEGNVIQSGNLKIDLLLLDKETGVFNSIKENSAPIYSDDILWEPGYTDVKILKVSNEGTLNLKWVAKFVSDKELSPLAEVIDVYVNPSIGDNPTYPTDRQLDANWQHVGTLDQFIGTISETTYGFLGAGKSANLGIALKMQETADNNYQDKTLGEFTIKVLATQATGESDSFDDQYDAGAEWPNTGLNESASTAIDSNNLMLGALTTAVNIDNGNVSATIPEDVKVAEGATSFDLTVKSADADGNISFGEGGSATGFDVHIAGVAADNTQPMTVNLGAVLPTGLGETELKLYHTENGVPELMRPVGSTSEFTIHNQYTYNAETGEVSIYVATFSIFSAVKTGADVWDGTSVADSFASGSGTEADPYIIETAAQLVYFRNQVDGGNTFAGKYVKLGRDINLAGFNFDPIGRGYESSGGKVFKGTFDGQNYTIYGLKQNGWELGFDNGTQGAGLFASVVDATIKNLTISGADIKFDCVDMGIVVGYAYGTCNFENIIVTKSTIANYNRYTGGVVGEVNGTHTFKDIIVDSTVTISSLWGSFDTAIGGVIGGKYGNATVSMTNVIVACELDVYSDVTAAYQWYAYRRCGMLIGHTEQNSPKSALNADAPFLTCDNVKVYYGDWVNYNYYQFEKQDNDTGKRYPWVRAEASSVGNNGAFSNPRYGVPTHGGVKVTDDPNMETLKTGYAAITFNQLYGGGQGVYGKADHDGVKIHHLNPEATKTIYFQNTNGWDNLKLMYIYKTPFNGDTWTTVVEGISLGEAVDAQGKYAIYKVTVPADAYAFTIIGDSEGETTPEIVMSSLADGHLYYVNEDDEIKHCKYIDGYKTVYFENNKGWTDVYLYYWCNDGTADWGTMEFPGEKMTLVSSEGVYKVYSFVIPAYATGFVFSDGKENVTGTEHYQSVDVKLTSDPDGKIFYLGSIDNNQVVDGNKVNYKYSVNSTKYVEGYKTVTFINTWLWSNVKVHYWSNNNGHTSYPGVGMTQSGQDESYKIYTFKLPLYADEFQITGVNTSGTTDKSPDTKVSDIVEGKIYSMFYVNGANKLLESKKIYLKPNSNWKSSNARFAAYVWSSNSNAIWIDMIKSSISTSSTAYYACWIPQSYTKVIFGRMSPSVSNNGFDNPPMWNRTNDVTLSSSKNCYVINSSAWGDGNSNVGSWSENK